MEIISEQREKHICMHKHRLVYKQNRRCILVIFVLHRDTQTILTIQNNTITKNHRISVTHTENRIWQLRIRDVKVDDQGWYMVN